MSVSNSGAITTIGDWADAVVVQSVGGGGGAGGTAVADGSQQTASINVGVGGSGGGSGNGGEVTVVNLGSIGTQGYGAYGVLAQSIGGGGGQGGDGSAKATGNITVGSGVGGAGGAGGNGGNVCLGVCPDGQGGTTTLDTASVTTAGDNAHAIVLQSIGGGGGTGGAGNSESATVFQNDAFNIIVGGTGGASGSGGAVTANFTPTAARGAVTSSGDRAFGLVAQSIGGGGGIGGAGAAASIASLTLGGKGGAGPLNGGTVTVAVGNSDFTTTGLGSHAVVAQSIGGGGGIGGDASGGALAILHQGANGNYGDGSAVTVSLATDASIGTAGDYAFGILAQSIGGGGGFGGDQGGAFAGSNGNLSSSGKSGTVTVTVAGSIQATGAGGIGVFAQSDAVTDSNGAVVVDVSGSVTGGSGPDGYGVYIAGGNASNSFTIESGGSVDAGSGIATNYSGDATLSVTNRGRLAGSVQLRNTLGEVGRLDNFGDLLAGTLLDADLTNSGRFWVGLDDHAIAATRVGGDLVQGAAGHLLIDADLAAGRADRVSVDGTATLAGGLEVTLLAISPGGEAPILSAAGGLTSTLDDPRGSNPLQPGAGAARQRPLAPGRWGQIRPARAAGEPGRRGRPPPGGLGPGQHGGLQRLLTDTGSLGRRGWLCVGPGRPLPRGRAQRGGAGHPRMQGFTNSLLSCPRFEGDGTVLGEGSCVWARVTGGSTSGSRYQGTAGFDADRRGLQAGGQWGGLARLVRRCRLELRHRRHRWVGRPGQHRRHRFRPWGVPQAHRGPLALRPGPRGRHGLVRDGPAYTDPRLPGPRR